MKMGREIISTIKNVHFLDNPSSDDLERRVMSLFVDDGTDGGITPAIRAILYSAAHNHLESVLGSRKIGLENSPRVPRMKTQIDKASDHWSAQPVTDTERQLWDTNDSPNTAHTSERAVTGSVELDYTDKVATQYASISDGRRRIMHSAHDMTLESVTRTADIDTIEQIPSNSKSHTDVASSRRTATKSAVSKVVSRQATSVIETDRERFELGSPDLSQSVSYQVPEKIPELPISSSTLQERRGSASDLPLHDHVAQHTEQLGRRTGEVFNNETIASSVDGLSTEEDIPHRRLTLVGMRNRARRAFRFTVDVLSSKPVVPSWPELPRLSCLPVRGDRPWLHMWHRHTSRRSTHGTQHISSQRDVSDRASRQSVPIIGSVGLENYILEEPQRRYRFWYGSFGVDLGVVDNHSDI